MSGGGGGGGGGPDIPPGGGVNCESIHEETTLNSAKPDVVKTLRVGDILTLQARAPRGPLVAVTASSKEAGSITSARLARILSCITEGHEYVAEVLRIRGGEVTVEVRHR
jgi:hypothetical protein